MTFLERPVLDTRPDFDHIDHGQFDDFKFSIVAPAAGTPWKPTTKLKRRITLPFLFGTKAEWRTFRDFIATLRGSQQGFWIPLWITDYESYENAQGSTAIKIKDINLSSVFTADEQLAFMALIDREKLEPYEIANITVLGNGDEQLNLATEILGDFNPEETACCAFIYCRVATEPIKYEYKTDSVVRCEVEFIELPREYVTPHLGSTPLYLYEFTRAQKTWRMTNWPLAIVLNDEVWSPDNIKHGSIKSGIDFLPEDLTLNVATDMADHPLRYYLARSAFEVTELRIWEADADSVSFDETAPLYKGRVGRIEFRNEGQITANCSSLLRLGEQQVPRMQVQRTCNHRLYDINCGASAGLYEISGPLIGVTDDYVEAVEFATEAAARSDAVWFALGKVVIGDETRMVVGQSVGKLYLDEPFYAAEVGQVASAWPGCNKRVSHCVGRFNNILNTLQFPYMPNTNPQLGDLLNPKPPGGKK